MDDDPEIEEKTKASDVGGLHEEGVDILSDAEARGESTKPAEDIKVKEEMAAYLRDFDVGTQPNGAPKPANEVGKKLFATASPFIPKAPAVIPVKPFVETPAPEGVKPGVLSDMGNKVFGGGPVAPKIKPIEVPRTAEEAVPDVPSINASDVKPLRTYKTDTEEAVRYQNMSVISIKTAETKKIESKPISIEREEIKKPIPWTAIIVSIILILGGGGILAFSYISKKSNLTPVQIEIAREKTIIRTDDSVDYMMTGNPIKSFADKASQISVEKIGVLRVKPTTQGSTTTIALSPKGFFKDSGMPERIIRVLGDEMLLAVVGNSSTLQPIMMFKTLYFENTFAGMLEWEKTMDRSLESLIRMTSVVDQNSSSTPKFIWSDKIILNKDTRVLKNSNELLLVYSILDKNTVLISTTIEALGEVIKRYTEARVIR